MLFRKLRWEDHKSEASLGNLAKSDCKRKLKRTIYVAQGYTVHLACVRPWVKRGKLHKYCLTVSVHEKHLGDMLWHGDSLEVTDISRAAVVQEAGLGPEDDSGTAPLCCRERQ